MTDSLSPAAEAVLEAAYTLADLLNREVTQDEMIAAALEALADQVVPDYPTNAPYRDLDMWELACREKRDEILGIAAELRGDSLTIQGD